MLSPWLPATPKSCDENWKSSVGERGLPYKAIYCVMSSWRLALLWLEARSIDAEKGGLPLTMGDKSGSFI